MHRFFLSDTRGEELCLHGREAHHALHVLRLREGDRVIVLNGAGCEVQAQLAGHHRDQVRLRVLESRETPPTKCRVTLFQAIPKGKFLEAIIQKGTELGVSQIVPILSEHVVSHLAEQRAAAKSGKWRQVAVEAIKQCGQTWLPEISPPVTISEALNNPQAFELPLIASLQPGSRHPREWFDAFRHDHGRNPASACIWVGPEGDFTASEVAQVMTAGARPISLGPLVLRVETAATYCLSILAYELYQEDRKKT